MNKYRSRLAKRRSIGELLESRRLLEGIAVSTLPAQDIELRAATIGFELSDTGGTGPVLWLYWGDEDGGTNARDWDNNVPFGMVDVGQHVAMLPDLAVNHQYFYRAFALALTGDLAWTDVATFRTLAPQLPTAEFGAVRNVSGTAFDISGEVFDDGGDPTSVIVYFGTEDGGDDAANWQNSVDLGVIEGPFETKISALLPGTEYFVRPSATNGAGPSWGATEQIQTVAIAPLRISEFMSANSSTLETRFRTNVESRFQSGTEQHFDWIEVQNALTEPVDISGYHLTDSQADPTKWRFPEGSIVPASGTIVVYASGFDSIDPQQDDNEMLHTNFKISRDGEYLGLTNRDGNVVHAIPNFPRQSYDTSYGYFGNTLGTFRQATPNAPNVPLGPEVIDVSHAWQNDDPSGQWTVTARIGKSVHPIGSIKLVYRLVFEDEVSVDMSDDGTGADATASDGVFTAVIPAGLAQPGQMLRYYVAATDTKGILGRAPLFAGAESTAEYFGTMIPDPTIDTRLPVIHRFVEEPDRANTVRGTRASVYYNGEFYDNIFLRSRGGTAQSWPKKAFKFEFNDDQHFEFRPGVPRVDEINVNTTFTDKSYTRAILTSDFQLAAGTPSPESFHIRMHENGEFYSVAIFVEQPDRDFLRRHDLDPEGSLYKGGPGATLQRITGLEKKTRDFEDNSDVVALTDGLKLTDGELEYFLFDNIDLPAQINFMATVVLTQNIDASDKNYYLYRDTNGTGEWRMMPWDLDLTFGPDALNTNTIIADQNTRGARNPNAVQPYLGSRAVTLDGASKFNEIQDRIITNPRTQQMLNRRIRTLVDEFLATGYFENRIDQLVELIAKDVVEDRARWGNSAHFGGVVLALDEEAARIKNEYLAPRLPYLTDYHVNGGVGIPESQLDSAPVRFGDAIDFAPDGDPLSEYFTIVNGNAYPIDISGWTVSGAVTATFAPGTVIPAGESLYMTASVPAFRARPSGPSGGQGRFVQGYTGEMASDAGTLIIRHRNGTEITRTDYGGNIALEADFNGDGVVNADDIDLISEGVRRNDARFDLNQDGLIDAQDRNLMISGSLATSLGDTNLDGIFNSNDLVLAVQAGQYEDGVPINSGWVEGDWDGDGDFTSQDLVAALSSGGYSIDATQVLSPALVQIVADSLDDDGGKRSAGW